MQALTHIRHYKQVKVRPSWWTSTSTVPCMISYLSTHHCMSIFQPHLTRPPPECARKPPANALTKREERRRSSGGQSFPRYVIQTPSGTGAVRQRLFHDVDLDGEHGSELHPSEGSSPVRLGHTW